MPLHSSIEHHQSRQKYRQSVDETKESKSPSRLDNVKRRKINHSYKPQMSYQTAEWPSIGLNIQSILNNLQRKHGVTKRADSRRRKFARKNDQLMPVKEGEKMHHTSNDSVIVDDVSQAQIVPNTVSDSATLNGLKSSSSHDCPLIQCKGNMESEDILQSKTSPIILDDTSSDQSLNEIDGDLSRSSCLVIDENQILSTERTNDETPELGLEVPNNDNGKSSQDSGHESNAAPLVHWSPTDIRRARPDLFFAGVVVLVNGFTNPDTETLQRLLHKHGGDLEKYETTRVTHIIAEHLSTAKAKLYRKAKKPRPVVNPSWIVDCVNAQTLLPFGPYLIHDSTR